MITNKTHTVDWNKTAHIAGVVIVAIAQCAWWLTKRIGKIAVAILAVLAKVFIALISVWAATPAVSQNDERFEDTPLRAQDGNGHYLDNDLPV